MFEFTLFRIPIRVEPWFWLTSFLLGGGLWLKDRNDIIGVALWMIVIFFSIVVHELGHALCSRKLTGANPNIRLWAMGGLAYPNTSLSRKDSLKVSLAGPAAGFILFLAVILFCVIRWGPVHGLDVISWFAFKSKNSLIGDGRAFASMHTVTYQILGALVFINLWWSLVNLLPVYPLDGGQAYAAIESSPQKIYRVGLITGVLAAVAGLLFYGSIYVAVLFGYLAYQNWQRLQNFGPR